ncbi:MAG: WG repeat-containing protein [Azoarcus sp.]|jgi:hypothetical protein|nr:WG repeat-containing protein [Azoarcus sp.]
MLITCPDCQKQISDLAPACPNCGRPGPFEGLGPVTPAKAAMTPAPGAKSRRGMGKWVLGLLVAILVAGGVGFPVFGSPEKEEASLQYLKIGGRCGYINAKGEMVIAPRFEFAGDFSANGLARIQENGKYGYINAKGEIVIAPRFGAAEDFSANGLALIKENGKYGYINAKGEIVIPPRFEYTRGFSANGLAAIQENGKWGYINAKGEMVIAPRFEGAWYFYDNGLATIEENGKYGYINAKGEPVVLTDEVCGAEVLKNGKGEIIWPEKTEVQICEE